MDRRSDRRRRLRAGGDQQASLLRPRDLFVVAVMGGVVLLIVVGVVVLSGGSDGAQDGVGAPSVSAPLFSPSSPDEVAIAALARNSIEVLPRGEWPSLYESFTAEYQERCPRDEFVAAGEAGAAEQGDNLPLLGFVGLEAVVIEGETATAVIVGEIRGASQYRVSGAFQKVDGTWKLAPAAGTEGCAAFNRAGS